MACTYYGWDCKIFRNCVSLHYYLHIVDAQGTDGEGVQIGQGDIDFVELGRILGTNFPDIPFIPEIWQGHKNRGEGFWDALEYLD